MVSSPVSSQLSEHSSHEFDEDDQAVSPDPDNYADGDYGAMPPSKKRRTAAPRRSTQHRDSLALHVPTTDEIMDGDTDVSSDTDGSVPGSPNKLKNILEGMEDEESLGRYQVRECGWEGCNAGDLGNQDELVKHVHDVHVNAAKKAKFTCEWSDCKSGRKPQMSAYALRAHMRSHTKEKPFYCALPECDKSFTRSDALAKHMRTVHETESQRTADHYAKPLRVQAWPASPNGPGSPTANAPAAISKPPRSLKLIINSDKSSAQSTPQLHQPAPDEDEAYATASPTSPLSPSTRDTLFGLLPPELDFTPEEAALPRRELYRLLRRQVYWAEQESVVLQREIEDAEALRKEEWLSRELALENVMEAEQARTDAKGLFAGALEDSVFSALGEHEEKKEPVENEEKKEPDEHQLPLDLEEQREIYRSEAAANQANALIELIKKDVEDSRKLPLGVGSAPWYRDEEMTQRRRAKAASRAKARGEEIKRQEHGNVRRASVEADDSTINDTVMNDAGDETEVDEGN